MAQSATVKVKRPSTPPETTPVPGNTKASQRIDIDKSDAIGKIERVDTDCFMEVFPRD